MAVSYAGILGIVLNKPPHEASPDAPEDTKVSAYVLALFVAVLLGLCAVLNRKLKNVHYSVVMFYHAMCGFCMAVCMVTIGYLITGSPFRVYTARQYSLLLFCCVCDCAGMFAHVIACQSDSSGFVGLIGYTGVLYA